MKEKKQKLFLVVLSFLFPVLAIFALPPMALLIEPILFTEMLAVTLVCSLPLLGLVCGVVAICKVRKSAGLLKGEAGAVGGVIVSGCVLLVAALLLAFFLKQFGMRRSLKIEDVTRKERIMLLEEGDKDNVCGIVMYIKGYIDGTATIVLTPESDNRARTLRIKKGKVRIKYVSDWYYDRCVLKYEPDNVESGFLVLTYYFLPP